MNTSTSPVFIEPARELSVLADADVVVVGGGAGGVGAAIAAARGGAKTILIERFGTLGGTWTSGLMTFIMVNWTARGIFEEFRRKLAERGAWRENHESWNYWGGDTLPDDPASYEAAYDAETAKTVLDEMVTEAGIKVYYFAQLSGVFKSEDGRRVTAAIIQSKEGRHVVTGKIFIDSSGDGDLCALAGAGFAMGSQSAGALQPMTMVFTLNNVDTPTAQEYLAKDGGCRTAWQAARARGEVTVPRDCVILNPTGKPGRWVFNSTRLQGYDATKVEDISRATIEGRRQASEVARFMIKNIPGFANAILAETGSHIGVRETRRIKCDYTVTGADVQDCQKHPDVIARGNWPVDIHATGAGDIHTEVKPIRNGAWYEIPYRSTTVHDFDNLFVASRCIDSTHEGHAGLRASPQVCAIGQGVGTAAAQMIRRNLCNSRDVDLPEVQKAIRAAGGLV